MYTIIWGTGALNARYPWEVNEYTQSCGPRGPHPGRSTLIHLYVGPGGPYASDPGGSTNIHIYVGPVRQGLREINKYGH